MIERNEDPAAGEKNRKIFGIRTDAIFETVLLLGLFWVVDVVFCDGSGFHSYDLPVNPFVIVILLLTLQYGSLVGLAESEGTLDGITDGPPEG